MALSRWATPRDMTSQSCSGISLGIQSVGTVRNSLGSSMNVKASSAACSLATLHRRCSSSAPRLSTLFIRFRYRGFTEPSAARHSFSTCIGVIVSFNIGIPFPAEGSAGRSQIATYPSCHNLVARELTICNFRISAAAHEGEPS